MALQKVTIQYEVLTVDAQKQLDDYIRKVGLTEQVTKKTAKESGDALENEVGGAVDTLNKKFDNLQTVILGALSLQAIKSFGTELANLAGKAQGISTAFSKAFSAKDLERLEEATSGTLSNLELMRQAVRGNNFKIPLDTLARGFEFATKRAAETGESVDFLIESIINGLGRKSSLVLDNLGISAAELQEEIKKTGDFSIAAGNIFERELERMGDVQLTLQQQQEQLNARLENMRLEIANNLLPVFETLLRIVGSDAFINFSKTIASIAAGFAGFKLASTAANFLKLAEGVSITAKAMQALNFVSRQNPLVLLAGAAASAATAFVLFKKNTDEATDSQEELDAAIQSTDADLRRHEATLNGYSGLLQEINEIREASVELQEETNELTREELELLGMRVETAQSTLETEIDLLTARKEGLEAQRDEIAANNEVSQSITTLSGETARLVSISAEAQAQIDDLNDEIEDVEFLLDRANNQMGRFDGALDGVTVGADQAEEKLVDMTVAVKGLEKAIAVITPGENAILNIFDAETLERLLQGTETIDEIIDSLNEWPGEEPIVLATTNVDNLGEAAEVSAGAVALLAGSFVQLGKTGERMSAFVKSAAFLQIVASQAQALANALVTTSSPLDGTNLLTGGLAGLAKFATISTSIISTFVRIKQLLGTAEVPAFAEGTSSAPEGMAWVGEKGPELVWLPKGAAVSTATSSIQDRPLIDAMNSGNLDSYLHTNYILPEQIRLRNEYDQKMMEFAANAQFDDTNMLYELNQSRNTQAKWLPAMYHELRRQNIKKRRR